MQIMYLSMHEILRVYCTINESSELEFHFSLQSAFTNFSLYIKCIYTDIVSISAS